MPIIGILASAITGNLALNVDYLVVAEVLAVAVVLVMWVVQVVVEAQEDYAQQ
jgi:hypothetical protein